VRCPCKPSAAWSARTRPRSVEAERAGMGAIRPFLEGPADALLGLPARGGRFGLLDVAAAIDRRPRATSSWQAPACVRGRAGRLRPGLPHPSRSIRQHAAWQAVVMVSRERPRAVFDRDPYSAVLSCSWMRATSLPSVVFYHRQGLAASVPLLESRRRGSSTVIGSSGPSPAVVDVELTAVPGHLGVVGGPVVGLALQDTLGTSRGIALQFRGAPVARRRSGLLLWGGPGRRRRGRVRMEAMRLRTGTDVPATCQQRGGRAPRTSMNYSHPPRGHFARTSRSRVPVQLPHAVPKDSRDRV